MKGVIQPPEIPESNQSSAEHIPEQGQSTNPRKGVHNILWSVNRPFIWMEKKAIEPAADLLDKANIFRIIEKISPIVEAIGIIAIPVMIWYFTETSEAARAQQEEASRIQQSIQEQASRAQQSVERYLNQLSNDLNQGDLKTDETLRSVTRARTLALLNNPDLQMRTDLTYEENLRSDRKGQVIEYLHETGLIKILDTPLNSTEAQRQESPIPLQEAEMQKSLIYLGQANLSSANLSGRYLGQANLSYVNLSNADLSNADLRNANLSHADLQYAQLRDKYWGYPKYGSEYDGTNLSKANFSYANLSYANLLNAHLHSADLSNAILNYADLYTADLSNANLSNTNLSNTNLSNANLSDASLSNTNLDNSILLAANLGQSEDLLQDQLITANSPLLCKTQLPTGMENLSNRDCDRLASVLLERYPTFFSSLEAAQQYIKDFQPQNP